MASEILRLPLQSGTSHTESAQASLNISNLTFTSTHIIDLSGVQSGQSGVHPHLIWQQKQQRCSAASKHLPPLCMYGHTNSHQGTVQCALCVLHWERNTTRFIFAL